MNKTQKNDLKGDIKSFLEGLKAEGVDFSAAFILPGNGKHDGIECVNAKDDHHLLDMLNNQLQAWTKLSHKK